MMHRKPKPKNDEQRIPTFTTTVNGWAVIGHFAAWLVLMLVMLALLPLLDARVTFTDNVSAFVLAGGLWLGSAMTVLLIAYHVPNLSRWALSIPFNVVVGLWVIATLAPSLNAEGDFAVLQLLLIWLLFFGGTTLLPLVIGGELRPARAGVTLIVGTIVSGISGAAGFGATASLLQSLFDMNVIYSGFVPSLTSGFAFAVTSLGLVLMYQIHANRHATLPQQPKIGADGELIHADSIVKLKRQPSRAGCSNPIIQVAAFVAVWVAFNLIFVGWLDLAERAEVSRQSVRLPTPVSLVLTPVGSAPAPALSSAAANATEATRNILETLRNAPSCTTNPVNSAARLAFTTWLNGRVRLMIADADNISALCELMPVDDPQATLAWSPQGDSIAVNHAGTISLVRLADANQRQIVSDVVAGEQVTWSPDGTQLAYVTQSMMRHDVLVMTLDNRSLHNVSADSGYTEHANPAWSPDGRAIAFSAYNPGDEAQIIVVSDTGGNDFSEIAVAQVIDGDVIPAWSPDGSSLTYFSAQGNLRVGISVMSDASRLSIFYDERESIPRDPQWTAQNTLIYQSNREFVDSVYEMNSSGTILRHLTPGIIIEAFDYWAG